MSAMYRKDGELEDFIVGFRKRDSVHVVRIKTFDGCFCAPVLETSDEFSSSNSKMCMCVYLCCMWDVGGTGEALPTGRWEVTRPGSVKRLIINDQMLAAVAALPGSTDAINSAQWSSGLLLGTCCSCHRARLIIPSPPSHSPSPLQPAATVRLLPLPPPSTPPPCFPSFPGVCCDAQGEKQRG